VKPFLAKRLAYLNRIWQLRYFWFFLVSNDLRNRYRRSFLGIGWSLVRPLGMTVVFCVVFAKLFNLSMVDYAPFLLVGMTIWQFFTESLTGGCQSFLAGSAYIKQQQVPLAIFPLRTVLGTGFHTLVALAMALAFVLLFKGFTNPLTLLALVPAFVLLLLLGWFLAILSGTLHSHFPDTQHLLEISLQILFYLTPVLYRAETMAHRGRLLWFLEINPLTALLALFRSPILDGEWPAPHHLQISLLLVGVAGLLAMTALKKLERTLVFWI
jgi:lipopolysaccharide transport system permease protein